MGVLAVKRCPICGHDYIVDTSNPKQTKRIYCTPACRRKASDARKEAGQYRGIKPTYTYAGRVPVRGIDPDEYADFEKLHLSKFEVEAMLKAGYFPPGLQLYGGGVKFQVVGRELCPQRLVLVQEAA